MSYTPSLTTFTPNDLTDANLARAAEEIERGRAILRSPPSELAALGWGPKAVSEGWAIIRDCEAMLASARRQATTSARLRSARDAVRHIGKDWDPQRGSR